MWTKDEVAKIVRDNKVVCFGKGTKQMPQCGFTMRAIQVLMHCNVPFEVVNIFDDPSIRPALQEYSNWPTTPQVFIDGEFIGGSDIVLELYQSGELQKKLEKVSAAQE